MKPLIPAALSLAALLSSCSGGGEKWQSPADEKLLSRLEAKTLEHGLSRKRRAELFFLWGQELAAQAKTAAQSASSGQAGTPTGDPREKAIGAFLRVVDLGSALSDEARINLEILWKEQQNSDSRDQQDQKGKGADGSGKDSSGQQNQQDAQKPPDQKSGQQNKQDADKGQNGQQGQSGSEKSGKAQQAEEKDLSSLVREKPGESDLDKAVQAEQERMDRRQQARTGSLSSVEKDW